MTADIQQKTLSDQVADEIRALLGRRHISQAELARRLQVSSTWLNFRLTGRQPIDLNDLQLIADGLGVEPAAIVSNAPVSQVTWKYDNLPQKPRSSRPRDNRPPSTPSARSPQSTAARRPKMLRRAA